MTSSPGDYRLVNPPQAGILRLILVRHGQTAANKEHRLQGASDDPMTAVGREQALRLGAHLATAAIDRIISSDLKRALETAQAIAAPHQISVESDSLLREWNCGEWDGLPASVFLHMIKSQNLKVTDLVPPGGERLADVRERARETIARIMQDGMGKSVLICSHGDFLRTMISCLLGISLDQANAFRFENASYTILEYDSAVWNLIAMSCVPLPWVN